MNEPNQGGSDNTLIWLVVILGVVWVLAFFSGAQTASHLAGLP